jgi:hypothetical protein
MAGVLRACESEGMRPLRIETDTENTAVLEIVHDLIPHDPESDHQLSVWIGAERREGQSQDAPEWWWVGDEGFNFWVGGDDQIGGTIPAPGIFERWAANTPGLGGSLNCAVLLVHNGPDGGNAEWNDVACDDEFSFVCEAL